MEKECVFSGTPLRHDVEGDTCEFCLNDEGREMLAPEVDEGDLENAGTGGEEEI